MGKDSLFMPITDDIASVSVAFGTFFDVPKILFMRPRDYQEHEALWPANSQRS